MKREAPLTALKDILRKLQEDGVLPINTGDGQIWQVWDEVVGPGISKHAQPSWLRDRKLRVLVSDPIWAQELQYVEADMRERLNQRLEREAIAKIEFRVGTR